MLKSNELCVVLEEIEEAGGVAKRLIGANQRVILDADVCSRTKKNPRHFEAQ